MIPPLELPWVLASSSRSRRELLLRLQHPFVVCVSHVDETPLPGEAAPALVQRLAALKARSVARLYPKALIIGSDQVATLDGAIIGKPGDHAHASEQLHRASGRSVQFYTGLTLLNSATGISETVIEPFTVHFRSLRTPQIQRYLEQERPYDCAGSFRSEGLGVVLFERLEGNDPSALMGLPLIQLLNLLHRAGQPLF
jgi:septum formation protein